VAREYKRIGPNAYLYDKIKDDEYYHLYCPCGRVYDWLEAVFDLKADAFGEFLLTEAQCSACILTWANQ
jgi:hypothetical protein